MLRVKYLKKDELFEMRAELSNNGISGDELLEFCKGAPDNRYEMIQCIGRKEDFIKDFMEEVKIIYPGSNMVCCNSPIRPHEFIVGDLGEIRSFINMIYQNGKTIFCLNKSKGTVTIIHNSCLCEHSVGSYY